MKYDHVFVCYSTQNYLKALYLSYREFERGLSSKIFVLMYKKLFDPSFFAAERVFWTTVESLVHTNPYIRILDRDRTNPFVYLGKTVAKTYLRMHRLLLKGEERQRVLQTLKDADKVYLFLENTYFSNYILKHRHCILVEEGLSTYRSRSPNAPPSSGGQFPGENRHVDEVLLQHPERAKGVVRAKARPLELRYDRLPPNVRSILLSLLGLDRFRRVTPSVILVGQAWSCCSVNPREIVQLYGRIINFFRSRSYTVFVKPHPVENVDFYRSLNCRILDPKVPIEVFDLRDDEYSFDCAVSVLRCSLINSTRLAKKTLGFVDEEIVVEDFTQRMFDEIQGKVERELSTLVSAEPHERSIEM